MKSARDLKNRYSMNNHTPFVFLFILGVILTTIYIVYGYRSFFHSDSATVNLLLREQLLNKQYFPHDWVYVQDVWVLFINNIMLLFRPFVNDELLLRSIGVLFQSGLLSLVVFILLRKAEFQKSSIFLVLSLLFSGVSSYFIENVFGQAAYGNTIFWLLIMLFLVFNTLIVNQGNRKCIILFVLISVLNILVSSTGMRYIGILTVPLIITLFLFNMLETKYETYKIPYKRCLLYIIIVILSTIIGLVIYKYVISHSVFINGSSAPVFSDIDGIKRNFDNYIFGIMFLIGALPDAGQKLISVNGIMASYRIIFYIVIMLIIPTYLAFSYYKLQNLFSKFFLLFYLSSFIINTYIYIFGSVAVDVFTSRYFNNNLVMALILLGIYYEEFIKKQNKAILIFCLSMLLPFYVFAYKDNIATYITLDKNSMRLVVAQNSHDAIKEYLLKEHLNFGYASYWNAGVISVMSNYQVEVAAIQLGNWTPYMWLSSTRWYKEDYYQGNTFILLQGEEKKLDRSLLYQVSGEPIKILNKDDYEILVFSGNIAKQLPGWPSAAQMNEKLQPENFKVNLGTNQKSIEVSGSEEFKINVEIENLGSQSWISSGKYPVYLGAHLFDNNGKLLIDTFVLESIGLLKPNSTVVIPIKGKLEKPGEYELRIDMVQGEVAWFEQFSNAPLSVHIKVK